MAPIQTHYENLMVARNAPPEVIRAAYRTLSQKYHPDRNPDNAQTVHIMAAINASYAILSDPVKRQTYDTWVAHQEQIAAQTTKSSVQPKQAQRKVPTPETKPRIGRGKFVSHVLRNWILYGIAVVVVWSWAIDKPRAPSSGPKSYQANPTPVHPVYARPNAAPNGKPWPASAAYVDGFKRLHTNGLSSVTVDNSQNDSDVFVKLVALDGVNTYPVRQFFIPAFGRFTLNKVTEGGYDIRYRDLGNGGLSRSEAFTLKEIHTGDGVQYSNITMTLYKVQNGNMQTYGLSEAEF